MGMTTDGLSYWQAESEGIELLETTIGDLLDRRAEELPTQEAAVYSCYPEFGDAFNLRWTYQEYRERANQIARGLLALGLKKGDHIAVWAVNLPEWLLLEMAATKAGLVLVTVNPVLCAQEVKYILKQGDVQALFCMAKLRDYHCLATQRQLSDKEGIAESLLGLANLTAFQGNYAVAFDLYKDSLVLFEELGIKWSIALCLEGLAGVLVLQKQPAWAARLWGAAETLRSRIIAPLPPVQRSGYARSVEAARSSLGGKAFAAAWAEGQAMTSEQVLAALELAMISPLSPEPTRVASTLAPPAKVSPIDGLTAREVEILRLVAQGLTDAQVAEQLVISPRTVNWHLTSIYSKLQVSSRAAATRYAIEHHVV